MTDRRAAWSRTKRSLRNSVGFFLCTDAFSTNFRLHDQLQRGRATGGAELSFFDEEQHIHAVASTGPRHGGRGICGTTTRTTLAATRFNGAAPRGARN